MSSCSSSAKEASAGANVVTADQMKAREGGGVQIGPHPSKSVAGLSKSARKKRRKRLRKKQAAEAEAKEIKKKAVLEAKAFAGPRLVDVVVVGGYGEEGRKEAPIADHDHPSPCIPASFVYRLDEPSVEGKFGWMCLDESGNAENSLPFVFRNVTTVGGDAVKVKRFICVRIVETRFLRAFFAHLPSALHSCHTTRSTHVTPTEARLLTEINVKHCDCVYGTEKFWPDQDLLVRAEDAVEAIRFYQTAYRKLVTGEHRPTDQCGFQRVSGQGLVPYVRVADKKLVPLFFFEDDSCDLKDRVVELEGWEVAYLKFCCKVQGIKPNLLSSSKWPAVDLESVKVHFPADAVFEEFWPPRSQLKGIVAPPLTDKNNNKRKRNANPIVGAPVTWTQGSPARRPSSTARARTSATSDGGHEERPLDSVGQGSSGILRPIQSQPRAQQELHQQLHKPKSQNKRQKESSSLNLQQLPEFQLQHQTLSGGRPTSNSPSCPSQAEMRFLRRQAYRMSRVLVGQVLVSCINSKPGCFSRDLLLTVPDVAEVICTKPTTAGRVGRWMQDGLGLKLFKGNMGHQQVLTEARKYDRFDPVALVRLDDVLEHVKVLTTDLPSSAVVASSSGERGGGRAGKHWS